MGFQLPNPPSVAASSNFVFENGNNFFGNVSLSGVNVGSLPITAVGGTGSQRTQTPGTWRSKIPTNEFASASLGVACGFSIGTAAAQRLFSSAIPNNGGYTLALVFSTLNAVNLSDAFFIGFAGGAGSVNGFSMTPTGGIFTNNASFNRGPAYGIVSDNGDANWNFFSKGDNTASVITPIAAIVPGVFSLLVSVAPGAGASTAVEFCSYDSATGAKTVLFSNTVTNQFPQDVYAIHNTVCFNSTAINHGIGWSRIYLAIPDGIFN